MQNSNKILKNPLRVALVCLLFGFLMRVLQWPYASGVMFVSFIAIGILYALRFKSKINKKPVAYIKMALVLFWTTNGILRILDFPYTLFFQIATAITFVTWFVMEGTAYFMDNDRKSKNSTVEVLWNIAMTMGVLTIIIGGLMHIMHWEYAIPTLTIGLIIVTTYILKDIFSSSPESKEDNGNEKLQV